MTKITMYIVVNSLGKQFGARYGNFKSANDYKQELKVATGKTDLSIRPIEINNK